MAVFADPHGTLWAGGDGWEILPFGGLISLMVLIAGVILRLKRRRCGGPARHNLGEPGAGKLRSRHQLAPLSLEAFVVEDGQRHPCTSPP